MSEYRVVGEYYGADRYEGEFLGHKVTVCLPKNQKENVPFLWRCEFFGAFDNADAEMIRRGYPVAAFSISDRFGSDGSVRLMKEFYDSITAEFSIGPRAVLLGMSRGGLYAVNYAYYYPQDVAALYLDAPVLDLSAWPFGYGKGITSEVDTKLAFIEYGLNEETSRTFEKNPIDRVDALIENRIPVVLVAGLSDEYVPYPESGARLERAYRAAGAPIETFLKPECRHHPHGLVDPVPLVDAIESFL